MPVVLHIQKGKEYELLVWDVSESNEALLQALQLNKEQIQKYNSLSDKRKREYLGIRSSMKEMGLADEIYYDENGKPFIEDNKYISFSHSYGKVAVAASPFPIGVDIELRRNEKIQNIERKFIREDEETFLPNTTERTEFLHVIWGIKEGLYKLNGGNLWNFLHHYKVEPFVLEPNQPIFCWVMDSQNANKYAAFYTMVEEYYLIWVIDVLDI